MSALPPSPKTFQFVEGNERLDWGVLVAIDIRRLVKETNVEVLQRIVENLAFSRITRDEAATFTPDHIIHLFTLTQMIVQYLVYSQDTLARMNLQLNERVGELKKDFSASDADREKLREENVVLRKEVKAQRRTMMAYEFTQLHRRQNGPEDSTARPSSPQRREQQQQQPKFTCPHCGEIYHKNESLLSHMRKRHAPRIQPQPMTAAYLPYDVAASVAGGSVVPSGRASPVPPASSVTAMYGGANPTTEAEIREVREQVRRLERELDRERGTNDRMQHDSMMMMLQSALKVNGTPSDRNLIAPGVMAHSATGAQYPYSVLPIGATTNPSCVPIVPDYAAYSQYTRSSQQEQHTNALLQRISDLEKTIRETVRQPAPAASIIPSAASAQQQQHYPTPAPQQDASPPPPPPPPPPSPQPQQTPAVMTSNSMSSAPPTPPAPPLQPASHTSAQEPTPVPVLESVSPAPPSLPAPLPMFSQSIQPLPPPLPTTTNDHATAPPPSSINTRPNSPVASPLPLPPMLTPIAPIQSFSSTESSPPIVSTPTPTPAPVPTVSPALTSEQLLAKYGQPGPSFMPSAARPATTAPAAIPSSTLSSSSYLSGPPLPQMVVPVLPLTAPLPSSASLAAATSLGASPPPTQRFSSVRTAQLGKDNSTNSLSGGQPVPSWLRTDQGRSSSNLLLSGTMQGPPLGLSSTMIGSQAAPMPTVQQLPPAATPTALPTPLAPPRTSPIPSQTLGISPGPSGLFGPPPTAISHTLSPAPTVHPPLPLPTTIPTPAGGPPSPQPAFTYGSPSGVRRQGSDNTFDDDSSTIGSSY